MTQDPTLTDPITTRAELAAAMALRAPAPTRRTPLHAYLETMLAGRLDEKYPGTAREPQPTRVTIAFENLGGIPVVRAVVKRLDRGTSERFQAGRVEALVSVLNARYFENDPEHALNATVATYKVHQLQKAIGDPAGENAGRGGRS